MKRLLPLVVAAAAIAVPATASAQYGYGGYRDVSTVHCESNDNRTRLCRVDTAGGVRLVDQDSRAPCVQGRSWGYDRNGIWVSQGCRGKFQIGAGLAYGARSNSVYDPRYGTSYYGDRYPTTTSSSYYGSRYPTTSSYYGNRYPATSSSYYGDRYYDDRYRSGYGYDDRYYSGAGYYPGTPERYSNPIAAVLGAVLGTGSYDQRYYSGRQPQTFRCESIDGQPRFCRLPFAASRIDIRRQLSDTRCSEGYNWGAQRDGVWVERGCRAEFVVY